MKKLFYSLLAVVLAACGSEKQAPIDREALVARNNPQVSSFDSLASLSVGNGEFAFTVDATGLQTFPLVYKKGVPLGTQSQWGWHSFGNPNKYKPEEYLKEHDSVVDIKKYTLVSLKKTDVRKKLPIGIA